MLNVIDYIPEGLLDLKATELHTVLPGPTLIHLPGQREPTMFVSVLLHGNEHTGWEVMRRLLSDYSDKSLPRTLSLFIGNIHAAKFNQRYLEHQQDYNRVWNEGDSKEHEMMQQVVEEMKRRGVFLSVDIHNNTGKNPHYACINNTSPQFIRLANMFSRTVVYFIRPNSVQSMSFARFCPAVTVECGLSGETEGIEHSLEFVSSCLQLESISDHAMNSHAFDLYHTVATVKIRQDISFDFMHGNHDLVLKPEIESNNFHDMPQGTVIGEVLNDHEQVLYISDEQGNEVSDQYFTIESGKLISRRNFVPAMITLDTEVIRKDCLCYIMERYPL